MVLAELTPSVFIVKTAVPQAIMHIETDCFLGPCTNPYNRTLTPGGSSGGESALIAMKASVMGLVHVQSENLMRNSR